MRSQPVEGVFWPAPHDAEGPEDCAMELLCMGCGIHLGWCDELHDFEGSSFYCDKCRQAALESATGMMPVSQEPGH